MAEPDDFLRNGDPVARREELRRYIGRNADSFMPFYDKMVAKRSSAIRWGGFCWPAFFLGPVWFFYRKLWLFAGTLCLMTALIAFVPQLPSASGLIISIIVAMMARRAYLTEAMRHLQILRDSGRIAEPGAIERAGGVSRTAGWISGIISGLICAATMAQVITAISHGSTPPQ